MKKFFGFFLAVLGLAMCAMTTSCSSDDNDDNGGKPEPAKMAKYTIMFYGCGGANVDSQLDFAIKEVQKQLGVANNQVRFVVMYSTSASDKAHRVDPNTPVRLHYGDWATTYRYELTTDITEDNYNARCKYKAASEVELYRVETIKEFLTWAKQTAPAENYILMPVNHGGGFDLDHEGLTRAIAYDDNHGGKGVATKAFAQALEETGTYLKAIYWYGCLMGQLEVMTEMAPYCDYQFASSHVALVNPRHVTAIIQAINENPDDFDKVAERQGELLDAPGDYCFSQNFLNYEDDKTHEVHDENCDFACWRSDKLAAINAQVKKLATLLKNNYADHKVDINAAIQATYIYDGELAYADLVDLAVHVASELEESDLAAEANQIVADLEAAVKDAYIYRISGLHRKQVTDGVVINTIWPEKDYYSVGISIYTKNNKIYQDYQNVYKASAFDAATGWSAWLDVNEQDVEMGVNPSNDNFWDVFWMTDDLEY